MAFFFVLFKQQQLKIGKLVWLGILVFMFFGTKAIAQKVNVYQRMERFAWQHQWRLELHVMVV